jgi:hypothetical protein
VALESGQPGVRDGVALVRVLDEPEVNVAASHSRLLRLVARVAAFGTRVLDNREYKRLAVLCAYNCPCAVAAVSGVAPVAGVSASQALAPSAVTVSTRDLPASAPL